jgi:hypothetical protein
MALMVPLWSALILVPSVQAGSNLLENSPFLPTEQAAAVAQQAAPLELRSILMEGGQYEFSVYDTATRQSTWVGLKEPGHEFLVKTFDPTKNVVTVERRSRTYTLALKEARIAALAPANGLQSLVAGMPPPGAQPPANSVVPGGTGTVSGLERLRNRQELIKLIDLQRSRQSSFPPAPEDRAAPSAQPPTLQDK